MGKIIKKWTPILVCFLFAFTSCVSELDKYYATPDWLKGNSWEVLDKKGNFKLFLSAVARTSYKDLVQGKGIITVLAPTDSAFQVYLTKHNYASVAAIPDSVITKLVGFHLAYYSFNKESFEDYKPNGVGSTNILKGMYYKFRTKSNDGISVEQDPGYNNVNRKIMHNDRFVPVFSFNLFNSFGIDAKTNYEFFYPDSKWAGSDGFNISNASVKEYAIVSDNGYVYVINQVVEPLGTIYSELKAEKGFDIFQKAYDRFKSFTYDPTSTADFGKGDSLYTMSHTPLPPIASEWPVSNYTSLALLSYSAYNLFAPDNNAMSNFFDTYWKKYYTSIDQVNFEPMLALLENHVYWLTVIFPQQIEAGIIKSNYGTPIQFNRSEAEMKHMCSNGALYGLNKVLVPPMFEKVTAPMYCDPKFNMFLDMAKSSSFIPTLISNAIKFKVFYPSDAMILNNSNLDGKTMQYINTNSKKYGAQVVWIDSDNGFGPMTYSQKQTFAGAHVATDLISSRGGSEYIYRTLLPYNYIYINGNKVYSSALLNLGIDTKVPTMTLINGSWDNGDAYELTGETASALVPEYNQFKSLLPTTITAPDLKKFVTFTSAYFASPLPPYSFLQGERFITLVPPSNLLTTAVIANVSKAAEYLKRYFINVSSSNLLDYPFPGAGVQGTLVSFGKKADGSQASFTLVDRGTAGLVIIDGHGNEVKITNYFPLIYADGAVYTIDNILATE